MALVFRELIQPGTKFDFMGKRRLLLTISILLTLGSLAMLPINNAIRGSMLNWNIDFKGGTEIVTTFDKPVDAHAIRTALSGYEGVDVSTYELNEKGQKQNGYLIRLAQFGAVDAVKGGAFADAFAKKFADRELTKATFSGDAFYVNSLKPITADEFKAELAAAGWDMKPWTEEQAKQFAATEQGSNEYQYRVPVFGIERGVESVLEKATGAGVTIRQVDGVGAKAGEQLRNDGIKSLLYAIVMIMLYIAIRFDFRYGPGTVAALLHDAIIVVGVFAVFWVEFSLTSVAALLTVIGYSMNDTVVVFDRIRENEGKYKDKKLATIINISINETLSRTFLTSMTTMSVTLAMNLLGTGLVKNFAFAMNVGIVVGTYSTIFIAAPVLLWLNETYYSKRTVRRRLIRRDTEMETSTS
jgi:preprotein translocase subunit SecF